MTQQQATRFLAEKAMGWESNKYWYDWWNPFTDANHAIEVLDSMRAKGWSVEIGSTDTAYRCKMLHEIGGDYIRAWDKSLPAAICRAAVLALGGEVVDD